MSEENKNQLAVATSFGEASKSEVAKREEAILEFWREKEIFNKTLKNTEGGKEFVFYEGPPTANGKPGIHHLEARAFKDAIPRYKTMRGYHVRRKGGWDTHGLPVELQVEKKLGLNSKKAIEEYGIAKFNQDCKQSVWEYLDIWNKFTKRIGYWVDQDHPYVTYENNYIESLWNVVKKVDEQKLLYKDYKVVPWCPRCGTALSSHELAQGYQDDKDLSVTVKFRIKQAENNSSTLLHPSGGTFRHQNSSLPAYFLAWTTTPWTLPGNTGLLVGEDIDYVKIKVNEEFFILAKERLEANFKNGGYEIVEEMKGGSLVGLKYEPLYPYLKGKFENKDLEAFKKTYQVYLATFVTTTDGTGIVHTAVMYGQEDFEMATKVGLPKFHLVNEKGNFLEDMDFLSGRFVKDEEVAVDIIKDLAHRGLLFSKERYEHSYPHCWRCKTALIYYARDSWYIKISDPKIKNQLISENKKINWEPSHIREGRFGEWLREIKDWAISRERYWGTPLPVWVCEKCKENHVVGSIEDLKNKVKKSGNKYFVMRHGGTEFNKKDLVSFSKQENDHLTEEGKAQVLNSAKGLNQKIDLIITSPFTRTKETANIMKERLGLKDEAVIVEERLHELNPGDFDGSDWNKYHDYVQSIKKGWFEHRIPNGESLKDVAMRTGALLYELENKYKDKNILIVTHGGPAWLLFVNAGLHLPQSEQYINPDVDIFVDKFKKFENAEVRELPFVPLPHNQEYELDLHRPFIDEVSLLCHCGGQMLRTKEVMDVWFDSGAMPFAQDHYPFENKKWVEGSGFPADYISEAIDQTRGWFYTLHAVGVLMGRGLAYKNVICLGHLLDAKGKKMSKSLGNIVDPWEAMDKYGVDALRLWMYSVNQPGESKNFDEKTVVLLQQQVFTLLYNVLAFYELYSTRSDLGNSKRSDLKTENVLDVWILARLNELIKLCTENLDNYKLLEPVRAIREFIGDLSTWYVRRSRERIKEGDKEAKSTLYFVLKTLVKLMAPFAPFSAEDIWQKLKHEGDKESVHLASWPEVHKSIFDIFGSKGDEVLKNMQTVRDICTAGNALRQKANIGVRQPLAKLEVKNLNLEEKYIELVKDELNIKEILENKNIESEIKLDTNVTPALKAEGEYREFMRELQDERKKLGLNPGDKMPMSIEKVYKKYKIMPNLQMHMLRVAAVASLICDNFTESINKKEIITTCLLHDMGNIIKVNFSHFPEDFYGPQGVDYWKQVQNEFVEKYNSDEHSVTIKIGKELAVSKDVIDIMDQVSFSRLCEHRDNNNFSTKITNYSDNRVAPYGIVSYQDRMDEAKKRYEEKNRNDGRSDEERQKFVDCGAEIEKQIFAKCKIKPEDINDETVAPIIEELKNFMVE